MRKEWIEEPSYYESLSPVERQQKLVRLLDRLPRQLTLGETQIVENLALINQMHGLLANSLLTPSGRQSVLYDFAQATEWGVEAINITPEHFALNETDFPGTLYVRVGDNGIFREPNVQEVERRELLRVRKRAVTHKSIRDYNLVVVWTQEYEQRYHQSPFPKA